MILEELIVMEVWISLRPEADDRHEAARAQESSELKSFSGERRDDQCQN